MSSIQYLPTPYSYSSAVKAGECIYLGLHRGSGVTFTEQIESALSGIRHSLAHFNVPFTNLVKVTVWLKDIQNLPEMEKIFATYFPKNCYPARMTATTEFIDTDCLVMIEGIAYCG